VSDGSRSNSPRTPNDGRRSPFGRPGREPIHPPSPEILSNLDNAFPPFPTRKQPANKDRSRLEQVKYTEADPKYAPVSPRAGAGPLLQRMNTIAPGPFDLNGRPGRRARTPDEDARKKHEPQPFTTSSGHSRSTTSSSEEKAVAPTKVPKDERTGGYGGFGPPAAQEEQQPLQPENRSQTFPMAAENRILNGLPRRPSEPNTILRRPSNVESTSVSPPRQRRPSVTGPDRSRPLPPRGASLIRERNGKGGDAPPVPDLAREFGAGNPYHTPSASESSSSSLSSRPSPQRMNGQRKPSDTSNIDVLMKDIESMKKDPSSAPSEQFAKPLARLGESLLSPESPMDPAIKGGRLSPIPPRYRAPAEPQRRPTTSKGNCKGCGEAIKGKSVSSADGRLTGRYHKQCFVCKTCSEPFATATFYVIDDAPHCERHYHKLNGSMCQACDRGIEGQYLETERKQKYHPTCLTCSDCRRVLRDDYFEMNGKVYCERDAYRKAQQRNFLGTNRMERRTTRLMMM
jgi:hypothetical protein